MHILLAVRQVWLIAAAVLYLAGLLSLMWAAVVSSDHLAVLRLSALLFLLPGVPVVIFLVIPNAASSRSPYDLLLPVAEIVWVLAAAWAAIDQESNRIQI